jgi:hypothetical protein
MNHKIYQNNVVHNVCRVLDHNMSIVIGAFYVWKTLLRMSIYNVDKSHDLIRMIILSLCFFLYSECVILCKINYRKNCPWWKHFTELFEL